MQVKIWNPLPITDFYELEVLPGLVLPTWPRIALWRCLFRDFLVERTFGWGNANIFPPLTFMSRWFNIIAEGLNGTVESKNKNNSCPSSNSMSVFALWAFDLYSNINCSCNLRKGSSHSNQKAGILFCVVGIIILAKMRFCMIGSFEHLWMTRKCKYVNVFY